MTSRPLDILRSVFGHEAFRPLQEEIVQTAIDGDDAFVLMPTGGGKSLCYQIPALAREGTGVVVSPLLSLMKDQVDALCARGVAAAAYNSSLDGGEARRVLAQLHGGELDLLYVAPERLVNGDFLDRLTSVPLSLFAVDEAHCVSQWGHDFRPEYARLAVLAERFAGVPRLALTATADPYTRQDIVEQLGIADARVFVAGFDRPNIRYSVVDKKRPREQLQRFVGARRGQSGIVYCLSRRRTEEVADDLEDAGVEAAAYHAGLSSDRRRRVQDDFLSGRTEVVVATVAFGMGIDKPDVRFVVHYDLPKNIEGYYQETGRSGRDGEPAEALLLYAASDMARIHALIQDGENPDRVRVEQHKLSSMAAYAESSSCRRATLLHYFGDAPDGECANCDVCLDPPETFDATEAAQMALSCVYRVGQRFGMQYVVDVLLGSKNQRILRNGHDRLSTHGIGKGRDRAEWEWILRQLIHMGFVEQDLSEFSVLRLTERARPLLLGEETLELARPRRARKSGGRGGASVAGEAGESGGRRGRRRRGSEASKTVAPEDEGLFEELRALRMRLAAEREVPAYVVFGDASLAAMCASKPRTEAELAEVHGVGPAKLERYGATFLEAIAAFLDGRGDGGGDTGAASAENDGPSETVELFETVDALDSAAIEDADAPADPDVPASPDSARGLDAAP